MNADKNWSGPQDEEEFYSLVDFSSQADEFIESSPWIEESEPWFDDGYSEIPADVLLPENPLPSLIPSKEVPAYLLEGMNPRQREAVETLVGPLMVVAGPGSGKTRVLTHRVAALVAAGLAKPWQILAVTFTNKAANEMRDRITQLVGSAANDMWISTFHSACVRILRANHEFANLPRSFSIVDASDSQKVIKSVLELLGMPSEKGDVKEVASIISNTKNAALTSVALQASEHSWAAPAFDAYNQRLEQMGSIDFDDILLKTLTLLQTNTLVRERYQRKFKFVLVDEYQDTNRVQYNITQLLSAGYQNLCVVGDLDQSVYSWRGATPEAMGGFTSDYPKAKVVVLEQNYRSTKSIVETYRSLIEPNPAIHRPKLFTENEQGTPVRMVVLDDDRAEASFVIGELRKKPSGETTAILTRTNSQTRVFEEELTRYAITYSVVGALKFYDRAEVKDALSYLRFALNPKDSVSFARCVNTPRRGIGAATINLVTSKAFADDLDMLEAVTSGKEEGIIKGRSLTALEGFVKIIEEVRQACDEGPAAALRVVSEKAGLKAALEADKSEGPDRVGNLEELINGAAAFELSNSYTSPDVRSVSSMTGLEKTLAYLENVALISSTDTEESGSSHAILLTAHASKGKEFDHVWVIGVEDTLFPHKKAADDDQSLEEERRLLFVACSRPRLSLTLSRARTRMMFGKFSDNPPSPFIKDLPSSVEHINKSRQGARSNGFSQSRPDGFRPSPGGNRSSSARPTSARNGGPNQQGASKFGANFTQARTSAAPTRGPRIDPLKAHIGMRVSHIVFGEGVIDSLEESRATITFGTIKRILDLQVAPLKEAE